MSDEYRKRRTCHFSLREAVALERAAHESNCSVNLVVRLAVREYLGMDTAPIERPPVASVTSNK